MWRRAAVTFACVQYSSMFKPQYTIELVSAISSRRARHATVEQLDIISYSRHQLRTSAVAHSAHSTRASGPVPNTSPSCLPLVALGTKITVPKSPHTTYKRAPQLALKHSKLGPTVTHLTQAHPIMAPGYSPVGGLPESKSYTLLIR